MIFDLDGTLLDTLEGLAAATNKALEVMGFAARPVDAYRYFLGDGVRAKAFKALPEGHRDEETIDKCVAIGNAEYAKCWRENTNLYDGIAKLLTELSGRGISMSVLSNKPDELTKLNVKTLLADWSFDMVCGQKDDSPQKPDPYGALKICEQLGIKPAEFLYLGDTDTDMKTANAAGMYAVGVLWGFRGAEELLANGAKVLVDRPEEVISILDS